MRKKLSISLLLFGIALTSCVKQELDKPCPLALKLNSTWSPDAEIIPVKSGTTLLPLPEGTTLGVRVQDLSQTAASNYISYTAAADGSVAATNVAQTPNLLQKHSYDLSIYAPFKQEATTSAPFTHGEDVMWTPAISIVDVSKTVEKTLAHKMSQAELAVEYAADVLQQIKDNYPLANATIEVTGFYDNCTMDLATGVITPGATRNAKITRLGNAICFIPFTDGSVTLHIKLNLRHNNGTERTFELDYTRQITTGTSMLFTLKLTQAAIEDPTLITISGVVQPWVVGGNTDIDVI